MDKDNQLADLLFELSFKDVQLQKTEQGLHFVKDMLCKLSDNIKLDLYLSADEIEKLELIMNLELRGSKYLNAELSTLLSSYEPICDSEGISVIYRENLSQSFRKAVSKDQGQIFNLFYGNNSINYLPYFRPKAKDWVKYGDSNYPNKDIFDYLTNTSKYFMSHSSTGRCAKVMNPGVQTLNWAFFDNGVWSGSGHVGEAMKWVCEGIF